MLNIHLTCPYPGAGVPAVSGCGCSGAVSCAGRRPGTTAGAGAVTRDIWIRPGSVRTQDTTITIRLPWHSEPRPRLETRRLTSRITFPYLLITSILTIDNIWAHDGRYSDVNSTPWHLVIRSTQAALCWDISIHINLTRIRIRRFFVRNPKLFLIDQL